VRLFAGLVAAATLAVPPLHFPRDHFGHAAGIEWWYFTAYVHGSDGHRYSVFFTVFKRGSILLPVSQVVDLDTGARVGHTEQLVSDPVGSTRLNVVRPTARLVYRGGSQGWLVSARDASYSLVMTATPEKPYVLHGGGTGEIPQGAAVSRYYSATRMDASGTIEGGGRSIRFTGTAWFDHQWGNFTSVPSASHWDWFSCRFDDRTELMLYRFRDGRETGTAVDETGRGRLVTSFDAEPGARVFRAAGRRWPLDWTLSVPAERLSVKLHAIVPDQLFRSLLLPTFWEGAVTASGTKSGICFVEETS
jgi:predicted secreted hydrolase